MTRATSVRGELAVDVVHLLELLVRARRPRRAGRSCGPACAPRPGGSRRGPRRRGARARRRGRRPRAAPGRPPCRSPGRRRRGARRRAGSRRRRRSWSAPCGRRRRRRAATAPPPPPKPPKKTLPTERFIASAICLVRIEPEAPTSMPATISAVLSSAMPAAAAREAGERVERGDHDGHVRAADRQHRGDAEHPGEHEQQPEQDLGVGARDDDDRERERRRPRAPTLSSVSDGKRRLAQASSCSLAKATFEPQKEIEPMIAANTIGISASSGDVVALAVLDQRDQRHRAAADAVEQRHHLRHRGHLHAARGRDADRGADGDADRRSAPSRRSGRRAASRPARSPCPTAAIWLPRTAVRGPRTICRPTMNSAKPTM